MTFSAQWNDFEWLSIVWMMIMLCLFVTVYTPSCVYWCYTSPAYGICNGSFSRCLSRAAVVFICLVSTLLTSLGLPKLLCAIAKDSGFARLFVGLSALRGFAPSNGGFALLSLALWGLIYYGVTRFTNTRPSSPMRAVLTKRGEGLCCPLAQWAIADLKAVLKQLPPPKPFFFPKITIGISHLFSPFVHIDGMSIISLNSGGVK